MIQQNTQPDERNQLRVLRTQEVRHSKPAFGSYLKAREFGVDCDGLDLASLLILPVRFDAANVACYMLHAVSVHILRAHPIETPNERRMRPVAES